jgi:hypothetical protein
MDATFNASKRSVTTCRCGHECGDHAASLLWRPGWIRGMCSGPCNVKGCRCRAFHVPSRSAKAVK